VTSRHHFCVRLLTLLSCIAGFTIGLAPAAHAEIVYGGYDGVVYAANTDDVAAGAIVRGCSQCHMKDVTIPETVTIEGVDYEVKTITDRAFQGEGIGSVTIPDTVTTIDYQAFDHNNLTELTIPDSITYIAWDAFSSNALTHVTIPDSVITIGPSAFGSNRLAEVTIPDSVATVASQAFEHNLLTEVTIPDSVTWLGDGVFADNPDLTSVTFEGAVPDGVEAAGSNDSSLGTADGLVVHYSYPYDELIVGPGGFTMPTWMGYTTVRSLDPRVAALEVSASSMEAEQGGSITLSAEGFNMFDEGVGDVTDQITWTSDVATDEFDGNTVTFPHASPHTITATLNGVSQSIQITVIPAAVIDDDQSAGPLPEVGSTGSLWALPTALAMLAVGGVLIVLGRRREGSA